VAPAKPTRTNRSLRDTWGVYQKPFKDHLEAINHAPTTLKAYDLAIDQLGVTGTGCLLRSRQAPGTALRGAT
jgi:hypothetical protein